MNEFNLRLQHKLRYMQFYKRVSTDSQKGRMSILFPTGSSNLGENPEPVSSGFVAAFDMQGNMQANTFIWVNMQVNIFIWVKRFTCGKLHKI